MVSYLSATTLMCKLVGIVCTIGAGLSVGREGPFVHVSCCVAFLLAGQAIRSSPRHLAAVLRAAAAAGVAFTFGAPIGGLLFAAEASVTVFRVSHLPRALVCALSGLFAVSWLNYGSLAPFKATAVEPAHALTVAQVAAIVGLGVVCALLAAGFNGLLWQLLLLKEARVRTPGAQLLAVLAVSLLTALIASDDPLGSPLRLVGQQPAMLLPPLVGREAPRANATAGGGEALIEGGAHSALVWLCAGLAKLALTACTIALPIPCGLFIPTFIAGAFVGRAWAELLGALVALDVEPGAYALLGASALTGAATGTISTSVIALELTGLSAGEASPLALACVVAITLRSLVIRSVYDVIGTQRRLPGHALMMTRLPWHELRRGGTLDTAGGGGRARAAGGGGGGGGAREHFGCLTAADMVRAFDRGALPRLRAQDDLGALRDAAAASIARGLTMVPVVHRLAPGARERPSDDKLLGAVLAGKLLRHVEAQLQAERDEATHDIGWRARAAPPPAPRAPLEEGLLMRDETSERTLDLRVAMDARGTQLLDRTPFVVPAELSLSHLVNMFQMLELSQCFVLEDGWYLGTLSREGLSTALSQLDTVVASRQASVDSCARPLSAA
ncbi:hypothetical protein KFE25_010060 [Diacronema lutheri]|uniref:Chloride channel protein n=2 Tax=Diacronema lutheri TaxID=2081491 RepID=A0A8J6C7P2_DIALT|nr:hypothetical protein KFE25_010060 [Diacronema lutheri]